MKLSRLIPALLVTYVIVVAIGIEAMNAAWGHPLPGYDLKQEGSGYGKMRGSMSEFQTILILLGTWVYPASVVASVCLVRQGMKAKQRTNKCLLFLCAALCLAVLARFCWLGVFASGWGQIL